MAPSRSRTSLFPLLALASLLPAASWAFDCKDVAASGVHFDLGKLAGPHVVHWKDEDLAHEMLYKYNFTVDICQKLQWHKGGSQATECHHGARGMCTNHKGSIGNNHGRCQLLLLRNLV